MGRSREITGLITLLAMGASVAPDTAAVAQDGFVSSRPTFDCGKAKSPLLFSSAAGRRPLRPIGTSKLHITPATFRLMRLLGRLSRKTTTNGLDRSNRSAGWVRPPFLVNKPRASLVPIKSALRYFDPN